MQVKGDLSHIQANLVEELESLYEADVPPAQLSTRELDAAMLSLTRRLGREVAVYINRRGKVVSVSVGDTATVELPDFAARSERRLSGVRCVHTHPSGDVRLSAPDLSSLRQMRFDVMAAIGEKDGETIGSLGFLTGEEREGEDQLSVVGPVVEGDLLRVNLAALTLAIDRRLGERRTHETADGVERAILAGVDWPGGGVLSIESSMAELARLADTAGAEVVASFTQRREKPDAVFFFGRGKVSEITMEAQNLDATLLILDDEITPSQQRNLENATGLKVVDRTALILDIFAQRARSREGKLQVELAQLRYHLPRLGGQGLVLSRLGGGIGTRGPGETKLEVDRRHIRTRIHDIEQEIDRVGWARKHHRDRRREARIPVAALVGYTNAGKSTLLNALTDANVFAEDKLFATLDPTTRRMRTMDVGEILLTDTVGFIQKIPHTLVSAFLATLEEAAEADLLLHVVDASNPDYEAQIGAVIEVLKELGAAEKPMLYVFNKADAIHQGDRKHAERRMLRGRIGLLVSAKTGKHLADLRLAISRALGSTTREMHLLIPFSEGAALHYLHEKDAVTEEEYTEHGIKITARVAGDDVRRFEPFQI